MQWILWQSRIFANKMWYLCVHLSFKQRLNMIGRKLPVLSLNPVQTLLVSRAQPKIWQKIPQNWRTSVFWMFNCMWGCNGVRWMILSLSGYDWLKCIHLIFEICIFCSMQIRKSHQRGNRLCLTYWNLLQIICITSRIVIWSKSFLLARFQNLFCLLWFIQHHMLGK